MNKELQRILDKLHNPVQFPENIERDYPEFCVKHRQWHFESAHKWLVDYLKYFSWADPEVAQEYGL